MSVAKSADEITAAILTEPDGLLLCSDFDGTLSPIVLDPMMARPADGAIDALERISQRLLAVAIVTGRNVRTVHKLAGLQNLSGAPNVIAIGQYGVERWTAANDEFDIPEQPESIAAALDEIEELLDRAKADEDAPSMAGVHVEDKKLAIGVHTRRTDDPAGALAHLETELRQIADRHDLHVEPGKFVLELRSARLTKGDAVRDLIAQFEPQSLVFMGDDLGDLAAFDVLDEWQADGKLAVKIAVRSEEQPRVAERADLVFESQTELVAWLSELADELAGK